MISPIIKWDHSQDLFVPYFNPADQSEKTSFLINISDKEFEYIQGHVIDGKVDCGSDSRKVSTHAFCSQEKSCFPELVLCALYGRPLRT